MNNKILYLLTLFVLLLHLHSSAQVWSDPLNPAYSDTAIGGTSGYDAQLLIVNGKPAMAHYEGSNRVIYLQSYDSAGNAWKQPVLIDSITGSGPMDIAIINGNPAIVYGKEGSADLMYVRANDVDGNSWGVPAQVGSVTSVEGKLVLKMVNGRPAIAYTRDNDTLYYIRANDANGSSWGSAVVLGELSDDYFDMELVNGRPAIAAKTGDTTIGYTRATDADGNSWPSLSTIVSSSYYEGNYLDMEIVAGNPALAYRRFIVNDLCYVRATDSSGSSWGTVIIADSTNNVTGHISMAIIDDHPSIAYGSSSKDSQQFIRAIDSIGTGWGTPVSLGSIGFYVTLTEVSGNPAVAYNDDDNDEILLFSRASNSIGTTWNAPIMWAGYSGQVATDLGIIASATPVIIVVNDELGRLEAWTGNDKGTAWSYLTTIDSNNSYYDYLSVTTVNGYPAICYLDGNGDKLKFCSATDSSGSSWATPVQITSTTNIQFTSINMVAGYPAVIYGRYSERRLYYIRASDSLGSTWGSPVAISSSTGSNDRNFYFPSFNIINNRPAVAWHRNGPAFGDLMYCRAADSIGSSWGTVQALDTAGNVGSYPQLFNVHGQPAISYIGSSGKNINYIRSTDSAGSSWGTIIALDSTTSGNAAFAAFITNGKPALFYNVNDDQFFVTASDSTGSSWGTREALSENFNLTSYHMGVCTKDNKTYVVGKTGNAGMPLLWVYTEGNVWNGSTWSAGTPDSTSTAIIRSNITPTSFSCDDLYINDGYALNTGSNETVTIYGDLYNYGNGVTGQGTLTFTANGGAEIKGDTVEHEGTVIVESGCTLTTNNKLRLTSDSSNTGRIGESEGTISGDVYVQRYMPGKRCFRFYGHPFSSSIALSQLTDEIDITGSGGSSNGFTTTITNNPSAFWFDVTAADTSTSGANPGWTAFTSATSADWDRYELLRLLVRGSKGEGLNGGAYSPSAATFEGVGEVNQGTQVVTLTKGSNTEFVGCGNPFPSPVNMQNVAKGSNVGANYYAWDANSGASGAYVTNAWTLSYNLPAYSAFFTTVSANSNNTLTFEEQDKVATGAGLFKTSGPNDWVELYIYDSATKWDRLLIHLDDNAMDVEDKMDGKKLYNPNLDFFTLSKDNVRLAVDVRPYNDGASIPLGLTAYNRYNRYVIKTGMYNIPAGAKLYLHDKYLNTKQELKGGFEYWFDVTSDTASQGNNRFEINMVGKAAGIISANSTTPDMQLIPNPAHNNVKVAFKALEGTAQLTLTSATGQVMIRKEVAGGTGRVRISLQNIPAGMYIAELKGDNATFTQKLIKQ